MKINLVTVARVLAEAVHFGQLYGEDAYIEHPLRVSRTVKHLGVWFEIVALLHDVVEDSEGKVDFETIEDIFNENISDAVIALTRQDGELYFSYIHRAGSNMIAKAVKIADLEDHLNHKNTLKKSQKIRYEKALEILVSENRGHYV